MQYLPITRALISVTDKSNLLELSKVLQKGNVEIVSTGGTRKKLLEAGVNVISVSEVTNFPEILNGRVKTLHPHIHAGVLAVKSNPSHLQTLHEKNIKAFDLVCVNLYDFTNALQKQLNIEELVEEIDIGGPTLLRAGAKNFHSVTVLPDPQFYLEFQKELQANNFQISLPFRQKTAAYAFKMISKYDSMIAEALKTRI